MKLSCPKDPGVCPPPCPGNCRRASLAELRLAIALRVAVRVGRHLPDAGLLGLVVDDVTRKWAVHLRLNNRPGSWTAFWHTYAARVEPETVRATQVRQSETERLLGWWWNAHAEGLRASHAPAGTVGRRA